MSDLAAGDRVAGRYALRERLVEAPGYVEWRALDEDVGVEVGLWAFRSRLFDREGLAALLARGAALRALAHPNLRKLFDVAAEGEQAYATWQLAIGEPPPLIPPHVPLDDRALSSLVGALAAGLAAGHATGLGHGRLDPADVVSVGGVLKLGGVGVFHQVAPAAASAAWQSRARYLAPELKRGGAASPASDVYALAVIATECAAARAADNLRVAIAAVSARSAALAACLSAAVGERAEGRPATVTALAEGVAQALGVVPEAVGGTDAPRDDSADLGLRTAVDWSGQQANAAHATALRKDLPRAARATLDGRGVHLRGGEGDEGPTSEFERSKHPELFDTGDDGSTTGPVPREHHEAEAEAGSARAAGKRHGARPKTATVAGHRGALRDRDGIGGAGHLPGVGGAGHLPGVGGAGRLPGVGGAGRLPGVGGAGRLPGVDEATAARPESQPRAAKAATPEIDERAIDAEFDGLTATGVHQPSTQRGGGLGGGDAGRAEVEGLTATGIHPSRTQEGAGGVGGDAGRAEVEGLTATGIHPSRRQEGAGDVGGDAGRAEVEGLTATGIHQPSMRGAAGPLDAGGEREDGDDGLGETGLHRLAAGARPGPAAGGAGGDRSNEPDEVDDLDDDASSRDYPGDGLAATGLYRPASGGAAASPDTDSIPLLADGAELLEDYHSAVVPMPTAPSTAVAAAAEAGVSPEAGAGAVSPPSAQRQAAPLASADFGGAVPPTARALAAVSMRPAAEEGPTKAPIIPAIERPGMRPKLRSLADAAPRHVVAAPGALGFLAPPREPLEPPRPSFSIWRLVMLSVAIAAAGGGLVFAAHGLGYFGAPGARAPAGSADAGLVLASPPPLAADAAPELADARAELSDAGPVVTVVADAAPEAAAVADGAVALMPAPGAPAETAAQTAQASPPPSTCPADMVATGIRTCIDAYESPGKGRLPQTGISQAAATQECAARGLRLCKGAEWEGACRGAGGASYPYGWSYRPEVCRLRSASIETTGSRPACVSADGAYDMSGNVAEWVAEGLVRGGSASDGGDGRCSRDTPRTGASHGYSDVGFRCCGDRAAATR